MAKSRKLRESLKKSAETFSRSSSRFRLASKKNLRRCGTSTKRPPRRRHASPKGSKLETLLQHTQGDNPPGFDYAFNLDYGREYTTGDPTLEALREALDAETRRLVEEA